MIKLMAEKRDIFGKKLKKEKNSGKIPVVAYGSNGKPLHFFVKSLDFSKVWKEAGETSIIKLSADSGEKDVLVQDIVYDPVKNVPTHVDFLIVRQDKVISVMVPFNFIGEAPAAKSGSGTLVKVMHEIEVGALPKDLPHYIEVNLSVLTSFEEKITIKDLKVAKGVKIKGEPDDIIALVSEVKEEIEVPVAPIDLTSIEVEKKGKKEEEGKGEGEGEISAKPEIKPETKTKPKT